MKKTLYQTLILLVMLFVAQVIYNIYQPTIVGKLTANQAKDIIESNVEFRTLQEVPKIVNGIFIFGISLIWINFHKENNKKTKTDKQ